MDEAVSSFYDSFMLFCIYFSFLNSSMELLV